MLSYNISCIRDYLLLEEDTENVANSNKGDSEQGTDQRPEVRMIEFRNVSLAPLGLNLPVLVQINITLNQGELMMVAGPKKSGKSTLLLSLLYESSILQGSAYVKPTQVAYCGQIAWISNTSIRCNITGGRAFNPGRYERVLEACCLQDDLENLPHHDQTLTDEHVSNLTESQKQKIVSQKSCIDRSVKTSLANTKDLQALARAVYSEREIIVLDEIFGSWDLITANKIFSLLFGLNGLLRNSATTVVMAAYSSWFLFTVCFIRLC